MKHFFIKDRMMFKSSFSSVQHDAEDMVLTLNIIAFNIDLSTCSYRWLSYVNLLSLREHFQLGI
jgi:hypothetical protein